MFDANIEGIQKSFEVIRTTHTKKHQKAVLLNTTGIINRKMLIKKNSFITSLLKPFAPAAVRQ